MKQLVLKNQSVNSLKYLALIPLFLVACKKEPEVKDTKTDTVTTVEKPVDSISAIVNTERESNLDQPKIKAYLKTESPMNVRINQIRMPDNTFDGPFGPTIDYDTKQKGEYWLIFAKNNMADGEPVGKFFVKIE